MPRTLTGVVGLWGTDFPTQGGRGRVPVWVAGGTRGPRLCFLPLLSLQPRGGGVTNKVKHNVNKMRVNRNKLMRNQTERNEEKVMKQDK